MGRRRATTAAMAVMALAGVTAASAAPGAGSKGIGDPYYALYGNGGYDVANYRIAVEYTPNTLWLKGRTVITARATQNLSRFNLDLVLPVKAVSVNGRAATFSKADGGHELVVTPAVGLRVGDSMTVDVSYAGKPSSIPITGPSTFQPWVTTSDGAVAVGEPEIAAWWYPSNDHPRDKATFDIDITVPTGLEALSNGQLLRKRATPNGTTTWSWREALPMTTYLAFMAVGQFDITSGTTASGLPWVNAVASNGGSEGAYAADDLARTEEVVNWHASQWGPYPFDAIGGVAPAADFGFALENQTRPVYTRGFWSGGPNIYVVVHEQAHQWYGNSVSVHNWADVWLNEGFATFSTWRWSETHGEGTANQMLRADYIGMAPYADVWTRRIGDPGAGQEFSWEVYERGAMTLQALRNRLGSPTFFKVMRTWASAHRYGNASIAEFETLAEAMSGQDLTSFFHAWLYSGQAPAATWENGLDPSWAPTAKGTPRATQVLPVPASKAKIDAVTRIDRAGHTRG